MKRGDFGKKPDKPDLRFVFRGLRWEDCHVEKLVAFSCKKRGFCASCGARRMVETAALLVDQVLPERPLRQWVLSLPHALRFLLATNPAAFTQVIGVVYRTISGCLLKSAGLTGATGQAGADAAARQEKGKSPFGNAGRCNFRAPSRGQGEAGGLPVSAGQHHESSREVRGIPHYYLRRRPAHRDHGHRQPRLTSTSTHGRARMVFYRLTFSKRPT